MSKNIGWKIVWAKIGDRWAGGDGNRNMRMFGEVELWFNVF